MSPAGIGFFFGLYSQALTTGG